MTYKFKVYALNLHDEPDHVIAEIAIEEERRARAAIRAGEIFKENFPDLYQAYRHQFCIKEAR